MTVPATIGRYQVRGRLGQGGMGVLYLALDPAIDRLVAVKLLRVNNAEVRERFMREGRLAASLQHANIVTVYDVGEHEGQPFIAMEYIPGETLAELIHRRAALPLAHKLTIMMDVCSGLAYAHKHGIVHRDVKPANLIVTRDSGVKILDFGIARAADSTLTQVGMQIGTPNYMSPEQVEGKAVDHRSDIFAVGAVLYELLVYRQAFQADNGAALALKIVTESPEPVTAINPELDPALAVIVDRALAKRSDDRYQDLKKLSDGLTRVLQRLEAAQEGETMLGDVHRPPTPPVSTPRGGVAQPSRLAERRAARIAAHLEDAEANWRGGELDAALAATELAAELDPTDPRVVRLHDRVRQAIDQRDLVHWVHKARVLLERNAITEAHGALSRAMAIDPDAPDVHACQQELVRAREALEQANARARATQRAMDQARASLGAGALDVAQRIMREALDVAGDDAEVIALQQHIDDTIERAAHEAIAAARAEHEGGRTAAAIRRLESFTPGRGDVDRALDALREASAAAERAALAAWMADTTSDADAALREQRWEDALQVASYLRDGAGDTPKVREIVECATRGLELRHRREQAGQLVARARELFVLRRFQDAGRVASEALALAPNLEAAIALVAEIDVEWQAEQERVRREAEAARAAAEARRHAEEEARRRAEVQARLEREEKARLEAKEYEKQRALQAWLNTRLGRARAALQAERPEMAQSILLEAQTLAPNDDEIAKLQAAASQLQHEQRAGLAADERARVSVAWARAQFARGDRQLAITHLERVAAPHPLVSSALLHLRNGRLPPKADDDQKQDDQAANTVPVP